jgi:predicted nuclease with RNAse H fold
MAGHLLHGLRCARGPLHAIGIVELFDGLAAAVPFHPSDARHTEFQVVAAALALDVRVVQVSAPLGIRILCGQVIIALHVGNELAVRELEHRHNFADPDALLAAGRHSRDH